jgi:hypothetical protein
MAMTTSHRLMLGILALAAGLSAAHLVCCGRPRPAAAGPEEGDPTSWRGSPAPAQVKVAERRAREKRQVIRELLRGELTLLEAAAWFRYLSDNPSECPCPFREQFPGRSDGEKACRHVIQWVRATWDCQGNKSQDAAILARFQAELDALLAKSPAIELPW